MAAQSWTFTVLPAEEGLRLDQLLSQRTSLSRRKVREALKLGGVQVERRRVRVASRALKAGAEVRIAVDDSLGAVPDHPLEVIHEDEWILAVDKPADMPCQGTQASDQHDLIAMLRRQRQGFLALVHRLDTGTSGVLLLAKGPEAAAAFGRVWQEREVQKIYLARTLVPVEAGRLEAPIGRLKQASPSRFGCTGALLDPRPALTVVRPALPDEMRGLLPGHYTVCELHTGRTHQIRVHLAAQGAPILGDWLYGGAPDAMLWLHAWRLRLQHPFTGKMLNLQADPRRFRER